MLPSHQLRLMVMSMSDLYEKLGVKKSASKADIKKAFKSKAMKMHPDRGGKLEDFQEIQKAHAVLSSESRRKTYDETGKTDIHDTIEKKAEELLAHLFQEVIAKEKFDTDIAKFVLSKVKDLIKTTKDAETIGLREVAKLEKQKGRVVCNDEVNIFDNILTEKILNLEGQIKEVKERQAVAIQAKKMLEHYKDSRPQVETFKNNHSTFFNGFNVSGSFT
jgi:curved DNA-binding protein CbpA